MIRKKLFCKSLFYQAEVDSLFQCLPGGSTTNPEFKLRNKIKTDCMNDGRENFEKLFAICLYILEGNHRDTFQKILSERVEADFLYECWPSSSPSLLPSRVTSPHNSTKTQILVIKIESMQRTLSDRAHTLWVFL